MRMDRWHSTSISIWRSQILHAQSLLHLLITLVQGNLADVYEGQSRRDGALTIRERIEPNNETDARRDSVVSSSVCAVV